MAGVHAQIVRASRASCGGAVPRTAKRVTSNLTACFIRNAEGFIQMPETYVRKLALLAMEYHMYVYCRDTFKIVHTRSRPAITTSVPASSLYSRKQAFAATWEDRSGRKQVECSVSAESFAYIACSHNTGSDWHRAHAAMDQNILWCM
jgi:hypothetical protein